MFGAVANRAAEEQCFGSPFPARFDPSSSHWDSWLISELYALNFWVTSSCVFAFVVDIYTASDKNEVEWDMYATIPYFRGSHDHYGYDRWKNHLEEFFSYFSPTSEQKCCYAQMRLVGEAYCWWKDSHSFCRCWFVLQDLLRTWYAPHLLFIEFWESIDGIWKILEGMT